MYFGFSLDLNSDTAINPYNGDDLIFLRLYDSSGGVQMAFGINKTTHTLRVFRGMGTLLDASSGAYPEDASGYLEIHVVVSDTVGVIQVKLNGALVVDYSGDTKDTSVANIATIGIANQNTGTLYYCTAHFHVDDFVMGTTDWPGQPVVIPVFPDADGTHSDWTSTDGDQHSAIDELGTYGNAPDTATKLTGAVVAESSSVGLSAVGRSGEVLGFQLATYMQKSDTGAASAEEFLRIGGTEYNIATLSPGAAWGWLIEAVATSPDTAEKFTVTEIDSMEIGWTKAT